jgi:hypothetical protein
MRVCFGWIPNQSTALAISSALIILLAIGSALALRRYTIGHSATELLPEDRTMAIAIWPMPGEKIQHVVSAALSDERVRSALEKEPGAVFTAHILPQDYGMVNMFADVGTDHRMFSRSSPHRFTYLLSFVFPFLDRQRKEKIMGSPQDKYKVVFSRVDKPGSPALTVEQVTDVTAKMTPVVIADLVSDGQGPDPVLKGVVVPPRRSFWGDITMPMF